MSYISEALNSEKGDCKRTNCKSTSQLNDFLDIKDPYADNDVLVVKKKSSPDMVSHPQHYQVEDMTYEPIKVIKAWDLNFNIGSAVKYLSRYKKKFNAIEDLKKAIFYIQDEINHLESEYKDK